MADTSEKEEKGTDVSSQSQEPGMQQIEKTNAPVPETSDEELVESILSPNPITSNTINASKATEEKTEKASQECQSESEAKDSDDEVVVRKKKSSFFNNLNDSDDEMDESPKTEGKSQENTQESHSESEGQKNDEVDVPKKKFSFFKNLNDSDFSDSEEESVPVQNKEPCKNRNLTESGNEMDSQDKNADSESETKNSDDEEKIRRKKLEMLEQFHGSDSSGEEALIQEEKTSHKKKERKKKKKSKPEEDEKLKIYSETQRLMREKEISLPYHKPKQRTLKEFLNRKKRTIVNVPLTSAKKMQDVWKEIEESTQSVSQFFKSDSEGETEESKNFEFKLNGEDSKMTGNNECLKTAESIEDLKITENIEGLKTKENDEGIKTVENIEGSEIEEKNEDSEMAEIRNEELDKEESFVDRIKRNLNFEEDIVVTNKTMEVENSETKLSLLIEESTASDIPMVPIEESNDNGNSNFSVTNDSNSWMKNILEFEKNEKSNSKKDLLKRINPKLLTITPKLSQDDDLFIDLTTEKEDNLHDGAKKLLDRFVKNCVIPKRQFIKKEFDLSVSKEERNDKGNICNVVTEKFSYKMTEEIVEEIVETEKPGAKMQKLKMELEKKMAAKWEEEYKKKVEMEKEYTTAKKKEEELEEEWEEEEMEEEDESDEAESEPEENDIELVDKKKKKSKYIDAEAEESGEEAGDELEEDEDDDVDDDNEEGHDVDDDVTEDKKDDEKEDEEDEEIESLIPAYQPGGGFLNGGSTLTQPEGKKNDALLSPSYALSGMTTLKDFSPSTQTCDVSLTRSEAPDLDSSRRKLFDDNIGNDKFDLNDAFEFCSGRFPGTSQNLESSQVGDKIEGLSQLVMGESQELNVDDLISGKFDATQKKYFSGIDDELGDGWADTARTEKSLKKRITVLEDDEDSTKDQETGETESNVEPEISTAKILVSDDENDNAMDGLLIFNKKSKKNLRFSDDEDDGEDNSGDGVNDENEEENEGDEEKNEGSELEQDEPDGEVDYDSEENEIIRPADFIEKEAELSESEWSGDEDEKNLDVFEEEAGDQEELDDDQVRSQLGKIHMKRVLDDDKREVRLLQELFFEDGDLHSDGKGRDRKFRWNNLGGFNKDDEVKAESGGESQDEDVDGEHEEKMRKMRHEREQFLLEMKKKGEILSDDETNDSENSLLKLGRNVLEKCTKTIVAVTNKVIDEDSLSKKPFSLMNKRGSFLSRNEQFLSTLAKFTSGSDNINGPKNSKNFVFTAKSPEKTDPKRKLQDCNEVARKPKRKKLDPSSFRPSLLDQLA